MLSKDRLKLGSSKEVSLYCHPYGNQIETEYWIVHWFKRKGKAILKDFVPISLRSMEYERGYYFGWC